MTAALPVVAEVVRSGFVESVHTGSLVGLREDGALAFAVGTPDAVISPRSCNKPLQAVGMLRAGLTVDARQLAAVCGSHTGLTTHIEVVRGILRDVGLDESALRNVPGWPLDETAARDLVVAGGAADRLHQSCSGKHAGMLATCVANNWPLESYLDADHPMQQRIRSVFEELTGTVGGPAVDGCGAPLLLTSLRGLAGAFRTVSTAEEPGPLRHVREAMCDHPDMVGAPRHFTTRLMEAMPGAIAKDGAEGAFAVALPDGRALAVRTADGSARPLPPLVVAGLRRLGVQSRALDTLGDVAVLGGGERVGVVRAVLPG